MGMVSASFDFTIFLTFCKLRDSVGAAFPKVIAQPVIVTYLLMICFHLGSHFHARLAKVWGGGGSQTLSPGYENPE